METLTVNNNEWAAKIKHALDERRSKNPSYSYRALSRDLGISQSVLSKIMVGRRKVTPECGLKIALGLGLAAEEVVKLVSTTLTYSNQKLN